MARPSSNNYMRICGKHFKKKTIPTCRLNSILRLYFEMIYIYIPCDQIKKIRVGGNDDLNQSKHQNCTIQVTRFLF
jgi:thioredoxin-related protein